MKYYSPVLILIRFLAVALVACGFYDLICVFIASITGSAEAAGEMRKLVEYNFHQSIAVSIRNICAGSVVYFIAPIFARLIISGSDTNQ